ncbi:hypothetical protein ILP97_21725 [Amycolatopsis sp. H6(2020)]|nr:hypothetical protein [Amycolatopsis sp. H6(2020)]
MPDPVIDPGAGEGADSISRRRGFPAGSPIHRNGGKLLPDRPGERKKPSAVGKLSAVTRETGPDVRADRACGIISRSTGRFRRKVREVVSLYGRDVAEWQKMIDDGKAILIAG